MVNPFGNPTENEDENLFEINIDESMPELMPEGTYVGKCVDLVKGTSKAGNPMWTWTFTVIEGPHAGEDLKIWTALTPAAIWKLSETLAAFGLVEAGKPTKFQKADILNVMVNMEVTHDEYNGKMQASLDKVTPYSGGIGKKHTGAMTPPIGG